MEYTLTYLTVLVCDDIYAVFIGLYISILIVYIQNTIYKYNYATTVFMY